MAEVSESAVTGFVCPLPACGRVSSLWRDTCEGCGSPLREHARLASHAARLFNRGLEAAGEGRLHEARECFAAVVLWHPRDLEARNALAYTYLESGEVEEAQRHWALVLARAKSNALALRGVELARSRPRGSRSGGAKNVARKPRRRSGS